MTNRQVMDQIDVRANVWQKTEKRKHGLRSTVQAKVSPL